MLAIQLFAILGAGVGGWMLMKWQLAPPAKQAIYEALRNEPIPLPDTTPCDDNNQLRDGYLDGFNVGWSNGLKQWLAGEPSPEQDRGQRESESWEKGRKDGMDRGLRRAFEYASELKAKENHRQ